MIQIRLCFLSATNKQLLHDDDRVFELDSTTIYLTILTRLWRRRGGGGCRPSQSHSNQAATLN